MKSNESRDRSKQSSCEGKEPMHAKRAKQAAKRVGIAAYKCNFCHGWHIGNSNGRVESEKRNEH